jgi:MFS family permease
VTSSELLTTERAGLTNEPRRSRPWIRVAFVMFAVGWGGNEFTPLLVMYRQADGLSAQLVDLVLSAYVVGIIPAMIIGAPLSDRYGRRPVLYPAAFIAAAGSLVLALADGSVAPLLIGRVLSGIALGLVMAIGSSWVTELSAPPYDSRADRTTGARRATLSLTGGFGLGAAVAAALAQFAPFQQVLPYALNTAITLTAGILLLGTPETRPRPRELATRPRTPLIRDLRVPKAGHRRFLLVVLPAAPWAFGAGASAYAILPGLLAPQVKGFDIGFSGLLCLVTLGVGFAIQPVARRLHSGASARSMLIGMAVVAVGFVGAIFAAVTLDPVIAIIAAAILGAGYGLVMLSGLLEVQRIAGPDDLAGLTAVFYALTYVGFFIPAVLAVLNTWFGYPVMFAAGVVIALGCIAVIASASRRHLPA